MYPAIITPRFPLKLTRARGSDCIILPDALRQRSYPVHFCATLADKRLELMRPDRRRCLYFDQAAAAIAGKFIARLGRARGWSIDAVGSRIDIVGVGHIFALVHRQIR